MRCESTITVDMSDVYLGAKIQLPTRFRSREKIMENTKTAQNHFGNTNEEKSLKSYIVEDFGCHDVNKSAVENKISDIQYVLESGEYISFSDKDSKRNSHNDSSKATTKIDTEAIQNKLRNKWNK